MQHPPIKFSKMHGIGNDFMVLDTIRQSVDITCLPITAWANRHTGVGFDQLLIVTQSTEADFACLIFNADGSEAEQCGNGLRCVARFIQEAGLSSKTAFTIATRAGVFPINIANYEKITVTLGTPSDQVATMLLNLNPTDSTTTDSIQLKTLSLGNPHAIVEIDDLNTYPVHNQGTRLSKHPFFPNGTNVGFMQWLNAHEIKLRTVERGAGETHACGSNACAAALVGMLAGKLSSPVTVFYRYGQLTVTWAGPGHPLLLTGSASHVFTGVLPPILQIQR